MQVARDKVDLLTARFDVRKAELDVTGNELLSAIKARQNELTLEEARRRLAQLEEDVKSHATTNQAAMAVLIEKRKKAQLAMDQAQQTIDSMVVRAKTDGIIAVSANRDGQFFGYPGMVVPDYREGDNVSSGRQVAELLDSSAIEFVARVPETERNTRRGGPEGDAHARRAVRRAAWREGVERRRRASGHGVLPRARGSGSSWSTSR